MYAIRVFTTTAEVQAVDLEVKANINNLINSLV
jgi:hypothetical protein